VTVAAAARGAGAAAGEGAKFALAGIVPANVPVRRAGADAPPGDCAKTEPAAKAKAAEPISMLTVRCCAMWRLSRQRPREFDESPAVCSHSRISPFQPDSLVVFGRSCQCKTTGSFRSDCRAP